MEQRDQEIYHDLRRYLDRETAGYPATRSGVEIRILHRLFTPAEAGLALHLSHRPARVESIHEEVKDEYASPGAVEQALDSMTLKGAIRRTLKQGVAHFNLQPFVVGIWELHGPKPEEALLKDAEAYMHERAFALTMLSTKVPQMRTIPVEKSLTVERSITTYDHLVDLLNESEGPFVVVECICRQTAGMHGRTCRQTSRLETCMGMGDWARVFIEGERGRAVTREEALEIARLNQADGLVLQPSNTEKIDFVCSCCGCCCGMLGMQKALPKPVDFWASNYYAVVDAAACSGCGTCEERCQVGAVSIAEGADVSSVNLDRCIGCGNCVVTCPTGAMTLAKKAKEVAPPKDSEELLETIAANKKGALGKAKVAAKVMLRL